MQFLLSTNVWHNSIKTYAIQSSKIVQLVFSILCVHCDYCMLFVHTSWLKLISTPMHERHFVELYFGKFLTGIIIQKNNNYQKQQSEYRKATIQCIRQLEYYTQNMKSIMWYAYSVCHNDCGGHSIFYGNVKILVVIQHALKVKGKIKFRSKLF